MDFRISDWLLHPDHHKDPFFDTQETHQDNFINNKLFTKINMLSATIFFLVAFLDSLLHHKLSVSRGYICFLLFSP
jgi:hypothetical protein